MTPAETAQRLDEISAGLAELTALLDGEQDVGRALQRSVDQLIGLIPAADMASVTLLRNGVPETAASTSERAWAIDSDQYAAGDGPCLEAASTGQFVGAGMEDAADRWPEFARSARAAGVNSFLSSPLAIDEEVAGSMNLYSERPGGFTGLDLAVLRLYVTAAAGSMASARRLAEARRKAWHLNQALDSRAVIDQPMGVLMAREGVTARQAFELLASQSQNTNVKVHDLAARVVRDATRTG